MISFLSIADGRIGPPDNNTCHHVSLLTSIATSTTNMANKTCSVQQSTRKIIPDPLTANASPPMTVISQPATWILPRARAFCCRQKRKAPSMAMTIAVPMHVQANGVPTTKKPIVGLGLTICWSRKSCAMTVPRMANAREVRRYPRKVRSSAVERVSAHTRKSKATACKA